PTIRVLRSRYVSSDFHARLSAKGKTYRYRIWSAPVLPPFEYRRVWHTARPIRLQNFKRAGQQFFRSHDFSRVAPQPPKQEMSTVRTIYSVCVRRKGPCLTIEFDGDGFLYKMVRLIVGSLVKCALGKMEVEDLAARLHSGRVGPARFAAPGDGLFLVRVRY